MVPVSKGSKDRAGFPRVVDIFSPEYTSIYPRITVMAVTTEYCKYSPGITPTIYLTSCISEVY